MAKPLNERIESARSTDRVTITDLEALIADAIAERDRQIGARDHHAAEAVNLALSDDDREEADRLSQHSARTAKAYAAAIDDLKAKLDAKRNAESRKAAEAEAEARRARVEALAARVADRVPKLFAELIEIFTELETLPAAEAIARGVPGNFYINQVPVTQLVTMKIPNFGGHGLAWPIDRSAAAFARMLEREDQQRQAHKKRMADEAARWSRYTVEAPSGGDPIAVATKRGSQQMYRNSMELVMTAEAVAEAKKNGCTVIKLKPGERLGQPEAAPVIA